MPKHSKKRRRRSSSSDDEDILLRKYKKIKKQLNAIRHDSEKDDSCFRSPSHLPRPSLDDEISIDAACSNPNVNNTEEFTGRQ